MSFKIYTSSDKIKDVCWQKMSINYPFTSLDFLKIYEKNHHKGIQHAYLHFDSDDNKGIAYANVLHIRGRQIHGYRKKNKIKKSLSSIIIGYFNLKIAALGNNFLTNVSSARFSKVNNPRALIEGIIVSLSEKYRVSKFIFPDHFFKALQIEDPLTVFPKLIKLEVDEDMIFDLSSKWKSFNDYTEALSKKYRKRVYATWSKSANITIKELRKKDLEEHKEKMQVLFDNVRSTSDFSSALFNVSSYIDLKGLSAPKCKVYGYFLEDKLLAFSSELTDQKTLYSYFIGINYKYNKSHSLYERILYQTINNAIKEGKQQITFGRTAAEFKSNVGALPKQSYIYIYFKNPLLRWLFFPFLSMMNPKKWTQRRPFK